MESLIKRFDTYDRDTTSVEDAFELTTDGLIVSVMLARACSLIKRRAEKKANTDDVNASLGRLGISRKVESVAEGLSEIAGLDDEE